MKRTVILLSTVIFVTACSVNHRATKYLDEVYQQYRKGDYINIYTESQNYESKFINSVVYRAKRTNPVYFAADNNGFWTRDSIIYTVCGGMSNTCEYDVVHKAYLANYAADTAKHSGYDYLTASISFFDGLKFFNKLLMPDKILMFDKYNTITSFKKETIDGKKYVIIGGDYNKENSHYMIDENDTAFRGQIYEYYRMYINDSSKMVDSINVKRIHSKTDISTIRFLKTTFENCDSVVYNEWSNK